MSPVYDVITAIAHPELVQIDPDATGEWMRIGSGPWQRTRIIVSDQKTIYLLELRLDDGRIVEFHRNEISQV